MDGSTESLNIEYHKKRLLLLALNRYKTKTEVAAVTGLGLRTVFRMIKDCKIQRDNTGKYIEAAPRLIIRQYNASAVHLPHSAIQYDREKHKSRQYEKMLQHI